MADGEKQRLNLINSPEVVTTAQVQEMQSRGKLDISEKDGMGFWESDLVPSETYGKVQSLFDGYVTSIEKHIIIMELQVKTWQQLLSIVHSLLLIGRIRTLARKFCLEKIRLNLANQAFWIQKLMV